MKRCDLSALPGWDQDAHRLYLYAVEFDGAVKIGRTRNPRIRMQALFDIGRRRGLKMLGVLVAESSTALEPERDLVKACAAIAPALPKHKEWFASVPFADAMRAVRTIADKSRQATQ